MSSSITDPFALASQVNAVIKVRRGVESDRLGTIVDNGELIFSNDKKRLFVGDGSTSGGIVVGNKFWITDSFDNLFEIQKNDFVYRIDSNGFYALTGDNYLQPSSYVLIGGVEFLQNNQNTLNISYTLPSAEEFVLGGVMVREGLTVTDGRLSVDYDSNTLELVGNQLTVKSSILNPTIPYASYSQNGLVKISQDNGLTITDGTLSLSNSTQSQLSSNGYTTLPNGLIMQWGVLSGMDLNQNYQLVTLPATFANNIFNVQGTLTHDVVTNGTLGVSVRNLELSSFEICGTSVSAVSGDVYWQALGK